MSRIDALTLFPVNRPVLHSGDVTPLVYPSSNEYGIPDLDIGMQADGLPLPCVAWGASKRKRVNFSSFHFYVDDYRFTSLWTDPKPVVNSQCAAIIEPNLSIYSDMPAYEAIHRIGQKRWLDRFWQLNGIKVVVDLNVPSPYRRLNLLGIPSGWSSYATRGCSARLSETEAEYDAACQHAGKTPIFYVYGGGQRVRELAEKRGWVWLEERADVVKQARKTGKAAQGASHVI